jgi:hypothetical protein
MAGVDSLFVVSDNSDGDEHIFVCTVQIPAVEKHVQDCTVHSAQNRPKVSQAFHRYNAVHVFY